MQKNKDCVLQTQTISIIAHIQNKKPTNRRIPPYLEEQDYIPESEFLSYNLIYSLNLNFQLKY